MSVADAEALFYASEVAKACGMGHHAWVPWLAVTLDDGTITFWQTWCCRAGCNEIAQYDR